MKQATDNFQRRALETLNHGNTKKNNFQFHHRKFSPKRYSMLSYYYRHVTRGDARERPLLHVLENWKKRS